MSTSDRVNDFVVRFSNVNGTGSASANSMFAKALFRMGLPIAPKNIFPSNIQGLPTWYEVRVSEKGYLGRREGIDLMIAINPQTLIRDIQSVRPGGYFLYDSSKPLHDQYIRPDINYIGLPMMKLSMKHYEKARHQQLFKNIIYVGALAVLLGIDMEVIYGIVNDQFAKKPKLIPANVTALELGAEYIRENYKFPLDIRVEARDLSKDKILIDGNTATALGLLYGGASVAAWYPITPSTSVAKAFGDYAKKYRIDPETGKSNVAIVQAEDELAAIGMVIGASWNGARAFTATSGPGVSLMNEFIGLAYFAEIPVTLINVQRGGPSTGMPTRTQQGDIISSAYASHGDTKHVLLFPSTPTECFEHAAQALDLAERLQTVVIMMSDLDIGMNDHFTADLEWDHSRKYDNGKVLNAEELESAEQFGRYLDIDGDGIPYRTYPGTHPTKGSFFTRGTSHDEFAKYSELGEVYLRNVDRLLLKWETAKSLVPKPVFYQEEQNSKFGIVFFGSTTYAALEAMDMMIAAGINVDSMRICAFPFNDEVSEFIANHDAVYVIEQNRDGQMRSVLINELDANPKKLVSVLNYDGTPITATTIFEKINYHQEAPAISA
ncbi:MAG: 2-oxoglutarate ferredoxin oxidoreductase subunit alpha [Saprospiraceae bacterium]|jgi:2-oxoglutarate ferredoxin oxidoreductase subunit alpha